MKEQDRREERDVEIAVFEMGEVSEETRGGDGNKTEGAELRS